MYLSPAWLLLASTSVTSAGQNAKSLIVDDNTFRIGGLAGFFHVKGLAEAVE